MNEVSLPQPSATKFHDECPICFDPLDSEAKLTLKCNHVFHETCIQGWFERQPTCPICRKFIKIKGFRAVKWTLRQHPKMTKICTSLSLIGAWFSIGHAFGFETITIAEAIATSFFCMGVQEIVFNNNTHVERIDSSLRYGDHNV